MVSMDAWDLALMALASYVAVMTLVRMMHRRRDTILEVLSEQIEAERERIRIQKKQERRKNLQEQAKKLHEQQRDAA